MSYAGFVGRRLSSNIYTKQGGLLLYKGCLLEDRHLDLMLHHNMRIWEQDSQLAINMIEDEAALEMQAIFSNIHSQANKPSVRSIERKLMPNWRRILENQYVLKAIMEIGEKDEYTFRHSLGVAVISHIIGRWMAIGEEELQELTAAALLHDLGKIKIPDAILNKADRLTEDEYATIRLHANIGFEMVRAIPGTTEQMALVALQHHEREDGSGYPHGISGNQITLFSKIVAVADVFHTMISERVYKKPVPIYDVLLELYQRTCRLFDRTIVHCFIGNIMNDLIGNSVLLSNGQVARIVMLYPDDLIHPLVETQDRFYDLRNSGSRIVKFVGNQRLHFS